MIGRGINCAGASFPSKILQLITKMRTQIFVLIFVVGLIIPHNGLPAEETNDASDTSSQPTPEEDGPTEKGTTEGNTQGGVMDNLGQVLDGNGLVHWFEDVSSWLNRFPNILQASKK
uniref:Uncharacterized protein n=1 Tax=Bombyx mori TaxID=7091 RepID=A0A8R2DN88_BOMMO|nr:uncharacterized protein LOC110385868 [Bombyx mori]